ncbi:MAG TPA: histidine kinase dimerization/phosphoacceptor domain -containing protein, partial [Anaerolineales bacterium]|nr:histidine kinase dimerization/phosphoacceptor domain -containing protein [Anaerolineales bacterium]
RTRWQQTLDEGFLPPYERRLVTHQGNIRNFEITTTVIYESENQKPRFIQAVLRDITDRKIAEKQLQISLQEKEILLKEIHHRVKNNLQVISSLLYLQAQKIKDENLLELFRESQNRVAAMALVHEQLYQSNNFAQVNFGTYLHTLITSLFESYGAEERQIKLALEADDSTLDVHMAIPCGLLVSEIVSNALKYAFPTDNPGQITVQFGKTGQTYHLLVQDNGIGLPHPHLMRPGSLGLQLIDRLVAQISGTLKRTSPPGTTYSIQFPTS